MASGKTEMPVTASLEGWETADAALGRMLRAIKDRLVELGHETDAFLVRVRLHDDGSLSFLGIAVLGE